MSVNSCSIVLLEEGVREREETTSEHMEGLREKQNFEVEQDDQFTMAELRRVLAKSGTTAP